MPATGYRRALGQHFLKDQAIADLIAQTAVELAVREGAKSLLEIGPGKGAITNPLREKIAALPESTRPAFFVAERDKEFVLDWKFVELEVLEGDFLEVEESAWLTRPPMIVASNLPYSAGTAIVTRLARHTKEIPAMVLMFQAEVAKRLRAEVDTSEWGSLSVWMQNRWNVKKLCHVPPGAFVPPPDVQSEVVVLERREAPRIEVADEKAWEGLLKACFAHRRKMLRAGLKSFPQAHAALKASGVDETKRAEALSWDEWARLYSALSEA